METKDTITPSQYFENLKNAKQTITTDALKNSYSIFIKLAEKYAELGQTESLKKINFLADVLSKEEKLIENNKEDMNCENPWERVSKLVELNAETKHDLTRMKQVMIRMKNDAAKN